jgi:hypothetical protein
MNDDRFDIFPEDEEDEVCWCGCTDPYDDEEV